jgi:hypothetical protein
VNVRGLAAGLLAASAIAFVGVARPAQRRLAVASEEHGRIWSERRAARQRLQELERHQAARTQALAGLRSSVDTADPTGLRASIVESLKTLPVTDVRLSVRPGRPPTGATVQLGATGRFADVVRASGHLARAGSGLALESVSFLPRGGLVVLQIEGGSLGEP